MSKQPWLTKLRRFNIALHRDLGYIFAALVLAYSFSGIALNHVHDWNPDFVIQKEEVAIPPELQGPKTSEAEILSLGELVGEKQYKVYDFPTHDQVKIYYDNASLHVNLSTGTGQYEKISRRHFFYEVNALHRNSLAGWKWFSDFFAVVLIVLTVSGLLVLKGKHGFTKRGKWLVALGFLPPVLALVLLEIL